MKIVFLGFALLVSSVLFANAAETFSCHNSDGVQHIADDLMSLPAECRDQAIKSDPESDPSSVNYVPDVQQSNQQSDEFQKALLEEEQATLVRKQKAEGLVLRAQHLATTYENAVVQRKTAVSSNQYGSRDEILQAAQAMQTAREGKTSLLEVLESARLSGEQQQQIESLLDTITE